MLFQENTIILNCNLRNKEDIIRYMSQNALENNKLNEVESFVQAVLHRESEFSTGVGFGIAIPHGKSVVVNEAFVVFCKVDHVDWDSLDGTMVDMVFMIGVPLNDQSNEHLKILAMLSRKLMNEEFRAMLSNSQTKNEILSILRQFELI